MSPDELRQIALTALHTHRASEQREDWSALLRGGFRLVDQFDRDGCRYLIAERRDDGKLVTTSEWNMLTLRARGTALKVIASEIGLSVPSVSRRVRQAMTKLGLRTHGDLARFMSPAIDSA